MAKRPAQDCCLKSTPICSAASAASTHHSRTAAWMRICAVLIAICSRRAGIVRPNVVMNGVRARWFRRNSSPLSHVRSI